MLRIHYNGIAGPMIWVIELWTGMSVFALAIARRLAPRLPVAYASFGCKDDGADVVHCARLRPRGLNRGDRDTRERPAAPALACQRGSSSHKSRSRITESAYLPSADLKGNCLQLSFFAATNRVRSPPTSARPGISAFSRISDHA